MELAKEIKGRGCHVIMQHMEQPLVSIVSPIYGVEKFIGECLESLFQQTYKNTEFVFVNDKTPDNSMAILDQMIEKYGVQNVVIINHEKNLGLCGVRKSGIKAAKGDYIMIVDSDDKLSQDSLEILVDNALKTGADIVESDFANYYRGRVGKVYKRNPQTDKESYIASIIAMKCPPAIWGKLYRRDLFYDIDNLFVSGRDNVEDAYATPLLLDRAKIISSTNKVTYYYRTDNQGSFSATNYVKWKRIEDMIFCIEKQDEYFASSNNLLIKDALHEKKYWIKRSYYLKLKDKTERKKLMGLYPENDDYVSKKNFQERLIYYLMKHDMRLPLLMMKKLK